MIFTPQLIFHMLGPLAIGGGVLLLVLFLRKKIGGASGRIELTPVEDPYFRKYRQGVDDPRRPVSSSLGEYRQTFNDLLIADTSLQEMREAEPTSWSLTVLKSLEWKRFETLCAEYFRLAGYIPEETRIGADGGVDIRVYKPGTEKPFGIVQCKAWTTYRVGVKPVRELYGIMAAEGVANGMFMTSGDFTSEALAFAEGKRLRLVTGETLLNYIGKLSNENQQALLTVALEGDYRTPTCPQCGVKMTLRRGKGGRSDFWGCVRFPRCRAKLVYKAD